MGGCYTKNAVDRGNSPMGGPNMGVLLGRQGNRDGNGKSPQSQAGRSQLVRDGRLKIDEAYEVLGTLGEGCNGAVRWGRNRKTGAFHAVKTIQKKRVRDVPVLRREIEVMKMLDHPNIIKLYETIEDQQTIYLVMELCEGGELFQRIVDAGRLSEWEAALVFRQILRAVLYMHENNIMHRDLKPENFLFLTKEPIETNLLKVIDFGLSCHAAPWTVHSEMVGTLQYASPQVLSKKYDRRCDLWSCGVVLYTLLSGRSPFAGASEDEVMSKVRLGNVTFKGACWENVSDEAKDLVRSLLQRKPHERCTAEQAWNHTWLQQCDSHSHSHLDYLDDQFIHRLKSYRMKSCLTQAALLLVADRLPDEKIRRSREVFSILDRSGSGRLSLEDLQAYKIDFSDGFDSVPPEGVTYTEFLAAAIDHELHLEEDAIWTAFASFDTSGDGTVAEGDLLSIAGGRLSHARSQTILDMDGLDDSFNVPRASTYSVRGKYRKNATHKNGMETQPEMNRLCFKAFRELLKEDKLIMAPSANDKINTLVEEEMSDYEKAHTDKII